MPPEETNKLVFNFSGSASQFVTDLSQKINRDSGEVVAIALRLLAELERYKDDDGYVTILHRGEKVRIKVESMWRIAR